MKVRVTIDFSERERAAINAYAGREGLATRKECEEIVKDGVYSHISDIIDNAIQAGDFENDH